MNIVGKTLMVVLFGEQLEEGDSDANISALLKKLFGAGLITGARYDSLKSVDSQKLKDILNGRS